MIFRIADYTIKNMAGKIEVSKEFLEWLEELIHPRKPTYPNGFSNYLEFLIPDDNVIGTGALNNYLGCIDDTFSELATDDNGGLVEHASGYDMQMELADGTVIPFARLAWDATTGRIVARPHWASMPAAGTRYRLFFGKTGVTTDGADEGQAYAEHLMAPNLQTGADRTGRSRIFTPTGITSGTLAGFAATFNGSTSQLVRVNPAELDGLTSITIQALVQLSSTSGDKPIFIAGPNTGSDFGLHLWFRGSDGRLVFTLQVGANSTTVESPNDMRPAVGERMLVAAMWSTGRAPELFAGGELVNLAVPGVVLTGSLNATLGASSSEALIGYNRAAGTRWAGQIADLMVSWRVLSGSHLQTQERNYLTPRECYGVGEVNRASDNNRSPVLPPSRKTATINTDVEVNTTLIAYEGDTMQGTVLDSHTGTDGGTYTKTAGGLARGRFTSAGTFRSEATIRDNGAPVKRSTAPIIWAVSGSPGAAFPRVPPAATATILVPEQEPTISAALDAASPGTHISVKDGTYREAITSSKSGSAAGGWIVIKARTPFGAILAGGNDGSVRSWKFIGSYIWITGFVCNNPQEHSPNFYSGGKNSYYNSDRPEYQFRLAGSNLRVTNCRINSPCGIGIKNSCNRIDICYNTFTMSLAPRWSQANGIYMGHSPSNSAGASNILIARNKWTGDAVVTHWVSDPDDPSIKGSDNDGRYCFYSGNNEPEGNNTGNNRSVRFVENFVEMINTPTGWYCKRGYEIRRNFIRAKYVAFNQRHGGYSRADGVKFANLTDDNRVLIIGNNFDQGIFRLNDTDHLVVSNRMGGDAQLYYGGRRTQGTSLANYNINPNPGWIQAASRVIFVGNTFDGQLRAGEDESSGPNKFKVWGAAEATRWGTDDDPQPAQGDTIKGVKNYANGIAQPAIVRVTNHYGETTIEPGTAGYEEIAGAGAYGSLVQLHVARAELELTTGCDAP